MIVMVDIDRLLELIIRRFVVLSRASKIRSPSVLAIHSYLCFRIVLAC